MTHADQNLEPRPRRPSTNHKASFEVPSSFVVPSIFSCSNSTRFGCIPPHPSLKPRKPIPQTHSNEPTTPMNPFCKPISQTHHSANAFLKPTLTNPSTNPNPPPYPEQTTNPTQFQCKPWMRKMWDERKRDFARSGRQRDRVGVRGREV